MVWFPLSGREMPGGYSPGIPRPLNVNLHKR